jgi:hypothetical protein
MPVAAQPSSSYPEAVMESTLQTLSNDKVSQARVLRHNASQVCSRALPMPSLTMAIWFLVMCQVDRSASSRLFEGHPATVCASVLLAQHCAHGLPLSAVDAYPACLRG